METATPATYQAQSLVGLFGKRIEGMEAPNSKQTKIVIKNLLKAEGQPDMALET